MNRIVVAALPEPGGTAVVDAAGSHHLLHTQRVARGAVVHATDGTGSRAVTTLVEVRAGHAVLLVQSRETDRPPPARVVLLGLPKAAAAEDALVAGTEAGATVFVLVSAERSPPGLPRADRIERLLRTAVTQCGRVTVPEVRGPVPLAQAVTIAMGARCYGQPGAPRGVSQPGEATIAIGPEGGWSDREKDVLRDAGFAPIGLGPHILRTATAVAAALAVLQSDE